MNTIQRITQEVQNMPEELAKEVLDFIEYLEFKYQLRTPEVESLKQAQLPIMEKIWDNPDNEVWDAL
ncbi:Protein of unknown function [Sulfurivirga caldicuralii]|uniref:DUF2281 domain-containing protein n=1 Tax=Sulfurivirga caldicuralii TaxID=364032 RepID=A0A1N6FDS3_9GAMM|nr:DUF2281 domain-containing protein [Sulfurivirga caldicuralii]SIN93402.1 Protein of unknown function [Sulfurivirga caldicuralii]